MTIIIIEEITPLFTVAYQSTQIMPVTERMIAEILWEDFDVLEGTTESNMMVWMVYSEMKRHPEYDYEEIDVKYWIECIFNGQYFVECVFDSEDVK